MDDKTDDDEDMKISHVLEMDDFYLSLSSGFYFYFLLWSILKKKNVGD